MKFLVFFLTFISFLISADELISQNKLDVLNSKKEIIDASSSKLKTSWISPLKVGFDAKKVKLTGGSKTTSREAYLSLRQDIFRSGGIYYAIKYADSQEMNALLRLRETKSLLKYQIVLELLGIRQLEYEMRSSKYYLLNKEIDFRLKKDLYDSGSIDITFLNNTIIEKNRENIKFLSIENSIKKSKVRLKYLSDKEYVDVDIPIFMQVSHDEFMQNNHKNKILKSNEDVSEYEKKILYSSFLPKVTLNAKASKIKINLDSGYKSFHTYGLSVVLPLDISARSSIKQSRYDSLNIKLQAIDGKKEQKSIFEEDLLSLEILDKKIVLSEQNIILYEELISHTMSEVEAGTKTKYDLQTLQNTKHIFLLDIEINKLNKQKILAKLHYASQ